MTSLEDIVQRALLAGLRHHSKTLYGSAVEVPQTLAQGRYDKMTGHFQLLDVARDIAAAVEASLPKPCGCGTKVNSPIES